MVSSGFFDKFKSPQCHCGLLVPPRMTSNTPKARENIQGPTDVQHRQIFYSEIIHKVLKLWSRRMEFILEEIEIEIWYFL
jgi:hypothetical protein